MTWPLVLLLPLMAVLAAVLLTWVWVRWQVGRRG